LEFIANAQRSNQSDFTVVLKHASKKTVPPILEILFQNGGERPVVKLADVGLPAVKRK